MAQRLQALARGQDLVSRIGGDEFVILADGMAAADEAAALFSRVLEAFHEPFELEGKRFHVSPQHWRVFLSRRRRHPGHPLMRNADTAMYAAKAAGLNTYQLFVVVAGC